MWGMMSRVFGAGEYEWDKKLRTYPSSKADHPVVLVSLDDAQAYAKWAEVELPTEQEWEKAARGMKGNLYPWGDEWQEGYCNSNETGIGGTISVGHFSPQGDSPYGCVDMSGNVWEWTRSKYKKGPGNLVRRGGSWLHGLKMMRTTYSSFALSNERKTDMGFRVVVVRPPSQ